MPREYGGRHQRAQELAQDYNDMVHHLSRTSLLGPDQSIPSGSEADERGRNRGRGGGGGRRRNYKGKNFDPNYHNRFAQQKDASGHNSGSDGGSSGSSSSSSGGNSGYTGNRWRLDGHREDRGRALPPPTAPRSDRSNGRYSNSRSSGSSAPPPPPKGPWHTRELQNPNLEAQYYPRIIDLSEQTDAWMCSCPDSSTITECHTALKEHHEAQGHEYRVQLAASEHHIDVLRLVLDHIVDRARHLKCFISECYEMAEEDVFRHEQAFFRS